MIGGNSVPAAQGWRTDGDEFSYATSEARVEGDRVVDSERKVHSFY